MADLPLEREPELAESVLAPAPVGVTAALLIVAATVVSLGTGAWLMTSQKPCSRPSFRRASLISATDS